MSSLKKFTDNEFPDTLDSICPAEERVGENERFSHYFWIRVTKICSCTDNEGDVQLFQNGITPADIQQGNLADEHLISCLSCISEVPSRIEKLFVTKMFNAESKYTMQMSFKGERI